MKKILELAKQNKHLVNIIYNKNGEWSERRITVIDIDGDIVRAYCHNKKAYRNFKLDLIMSAELVKHKYNNHSIKFHG